MLLILALYWALLALSLFNTIALLWLGATVLLNAEHRRWSIWLAACGLLAGGAVFISHSAVLMQSASVIGSELNVWFPLGWAAIIFAPFAWYIAMLWHAGYWEDRGSQLHRRQRPALLATSALAAAVIALFVVARPLPFTIKTMGLDISTTPAVLGIPLLVLLYPPFIFFCIAFSLDALARPGPSARAMGAVARRRARPWLMGASLALLAVSVLVVAILVWLVLTGNRHGREVVVDWYAIGIGWLDLSVTGLVTIAVVLTGQAIVSYEIFTGRTLPTRGLRRQWHTVMILGAGYGLAVALSFTLESPATEMALLATLAVAVIFALVSRQSYIERERYINHLRPFVASEHVYDAVMASRAGGATTGGGPASFTALCRDVLGVRWACLVPAGGMASLIASPLVYPGDGLPQLALDEALIMRATPEVTSFAVDPGAYGGAIWAVPLWGARGMIGVMFLAEKADGGLYSQEDMELARSSGERLLDTMAGANLAQRLMALQRRRFVENQVLDQHTRRALHDEILPSLHAAMLRLSGQGAGAEAGETVAQLTAVHRRISALLGEMPSGSPSQVGKLGLLGAVRHMVEAEFSRDFTSVEWQIEPDAEERARALPGLTGDVVFFAAKEVVRNAARHGRGGDSARPLRLRLCAAWREGLEIRIADDGVGLPLADTTAAGGQGLALHGTMMAVIGGSLEVESKPGAGTVVTLFVPAERWEEG